MPDEEAPAAEFQCEMIRLLDARLKENGVRQPKRRKLVEELCFDLSFFLEAGEVEAEGKTYQVELSLKKGRKRFGQDFPYHEYAFGSVGWYYEEGGEQYYDERDRAEEEELNNHSNIDKADEDFPKKGYRTGHDLHEWRTDSGYIFCAWVGGAYHKTGEAFIWGKYFRDSTIEIRIGQAGKWTDWQIMPADEDDAEKRCLPVDVKPGRVEFQMRLDGHAFQVVSFKVRG